MILFAVKVAISAVLIVVISEIAKRSTFWGGFIASLPVVSVLGLAWLYFETKDTGKVAALASSTLWFVLPSLTFFLIFPALLKAGRGFTVSMLLSLLIMGCCYFGLLFVLKRFGINL